jgi:hypothetical protein
VPLLEDHVAAPLALDLGTLDATGRAEAVGTISNGADGSGGVDSVPPGLVDGDADGSPVLGLTEDPAPTGGLGAGAVVEGSGVGRDPGSGDVPPVCASAGAAATSTMPAARATVRA